MINLPAEPIILIIPDNRPSDYEYAVLSEHVYVEIKKWDIVKIKQEEWYVVSAKKGEERLCWCHL